MRRVDLLAIRKNYSEFELDDVYCGGFKYQVTGGLLYLSTK